MNCIGVDGDGQEVPNPEVLWQREKDNDGSHNTWYNKAVQYWDNQEASYNGVLGGFGFVSDSDVNDSAALIQKAMKAQLEAADKGERQLVALDCGAGVGRVTKELLLSFFHEVDLVEPSKHLLETAEKELKGAGVKKLKIPAGHRAANFYCCGLQQHLFEPQRYDVVWVQWCLLYLTDPDAVDFFQRAKAGLKPDGLIVVKENVCKAGFVVDKDDSSLTRSNQYYLELFEKSGMQLLYNVKQRNFPKDLFEVRMYVLKPR